MYITLIIALYLSLEYRAKIKNSLDLEENEEKVETDNNKNILIDLTKSIIVGEKLSVSP